METYQSFKKRLGVESFKFRQGNKSKRWVADCSFPLQVTKHKPGTQEPFTAEELAAFLKTAFVTKAVTKTGEDVLVICQQGWSGEVEG